MALTPCYDCGTPLDESTRGCPTCGRNFVAERAVARLVAGGAMAVVISVAVLVVWYWRG